MKKTYKTRFHSLSIVVETGKKRKSIEFKRDLIDNFGTRGASFTTDDVKLQKAIEEHEYFNRKLEPNIWTDDADKGIKEKEDNNTNKIG